MPEPSRVYGRWMPTRSIKRMVFLLGMRRRLGAFAGMLALFICKGCSQSSCRAVGRMTPGPVEGVRRRFSTLPGSHLRVARFHLLWISYSPARTLRSAFRRVVWDGQAQRHSVIL